MSDSQSQTDPPELRQLRHDLRGTMNAIVLCTSALEVDDAPTLQLEFLDDIDSSTDRLLELLDQFEQITH